MSEIYKNRLGALRQEMERLGIDGLLISRTDEFGSEYLSADCEWLAWLTGFDGSSGSAIVTRDKAMVMTDGRYKLQIREQVDQALFDIYDMSDMTMGDWLAQHAEKSVVKVGYDPKLFTKKQIDTLQDKIAATQIGLVALGVHPIITVWGNDRPQPEIQIAELFPDSVAGASSKDKRQLLANRLSEEKIDAVILTLSDSICWLLNVRGNDIPFNPLVLSYGILHQDGRFDWFVHPDKITEEIKTALGDGVALRNFGEFESAVLGLKGVVQYDDARSSQWVYQLLQSAGVTIVFGKDPCILPKACKSAAEQLSLKQVHIRDGVAVTRLLFWLEAQDFSTGQITELSVEEKLEEFRQADRTYRGQSFSTIAGWADHGAIIHYRATPQTNHVIAGNSFLLLDSGGQYEYGTTDITRTIVIGQVTDEMKDRYTRVLKGHIALASARFSPETEGAALDNLARQPLIDEGLNFAHGTGHGVGCFMCVHEEASSISPRGKSPMKPGMLVSNEPGYYKDGEYGIRHENLILCQEDDDGQYYFETVTCVPFDLRGVASSLLTDAERQWIDDYHRHVFVTLEPFLDEGEIHWLRETLFPSASHDPTEEDIALTFSAYD